MYRLNGHLHIFTIMYNIKAAAEPPLALNAAAVLASPHRTWYTGLDPGLSGVQGCESELPGEKVAMSLRADGPQLDSTEDSRSTMLERHSRLEAPADLSPRLSEKGENRRCMFSKRMCMFLKRCTV